MCAQGIGHVYSEGRYQWGYNNNRNTVYQATTNVRLDISRQLSYQSEVYDLQDMWFADSCIDDDIKQLWLFDCLEVYCLFDREGRSEMVMEVLESI